MKTLYLSTEVMNSRHGENNNKRNYNKKKPPIVAKISRHLRGQVAMEEYLNVTKEIKSTPPVHIIRDINNL